MDNLSVELDNFSEFRNYIKGIILSNEDLWKLIYYPVSSPLDKDFSENPYDIFNESMSIADKDVLGTHGVVLFKDKNDTILNSVVPVLLICFKSFKDENNYCIQNVKIEIKIIFKGDIQELSDGSNRSYRIAKLFDDSLNSNIIGSNAKLIRDSFDVLKVNEENYGYILTFVSRTTSYTDEIQIYTHNQENDSWGITRESYSLFNTETPIYAGIQQPKYDQKATKSYGYELDVSRKMVCPIIPEITESSLIRFEDKYYKIQKINEYDDYLDCDLFVTYKAKIK
jgi:hypothetical protein